MWENDNCRVGNYAQANQTCRVDDIDHALRISIRYSAELKHIVCYRQEDRTNASDNVRVVVVDVVSQLSKLQAQPDSIA